MALAISPRIDVIIPCHNAAATLGEAVVSALAQRACARVWVVDDGSTDDTPTVVDHLVKQAPERLIPVRSLTNRGAAAARNLALFASRADYVAFLDADDAYEPQALDAPLAALNLVHGIALARLPLKPTGVPRVYTDHAGFAVAWRRMEMTVVCNTVARRSVLLAAGGFPEDDLFRRIGGEDGALGLALAARFQVGTLFDQAGVQYRYRPGAHAERLLRSALYGEVDPAVRASQNEAQAVTDAIIARLDQLAAMGAQAPGTVPVNVQWAEPASPAAE